MRDQGPERCPRGKRTQRSASRACDMIRRPTPRPRSGARSVCDQRRPAWHRPERCRPPTSAVSCCRIAAFLGLRSGTLVASTKGMERWQSRPLARWGFAALLCFALLGLIPSAALAAISLVQQNNGSSASATSLPVPFTTAPTTTAGNVLIMVGGTSTGSLSGVSGGGVGNWFKAQSSTTNTHIEIWYGAVDVATLTSSTPVTVTAATAGGMWMTLTEFSGVSLAIDQTTRQAGTTSPASAPSITTTNASDLVILGIADGIGNNFGNLTPAAGWTALTTGAVTPPVAQSS